MRAALSEVLPAGHVTLADILKFWYRPGTDRLFTVIRDPIEIAFSQVNYVAHKLLTRTDTAADDWRRRLEWKVTGIPHEVAISVLQTKGLLHENPMCKFLGDGTWMGALDLIRQSGIEIVDLRDLTSWLGRNWPHVASARRHNVAPPSLVPGWLEPGDWKRIRDISGQDADLYDALRTRTHQDARGAMAILRVQKQLA